MEPHSNVANDAIGVETDAAPPGLDQAEAASRLLDEGPNEPGGARPRSALREILALLANPLVLILLVAAGLAAILGQSVDASVIAVIVVLSAALNFVQTFRSQRAADSLRERVAPTATVRRDRDWRDVPRREVVREDVIRLSAGDLVPADARLVAARDLHLQEAALTGESLPVEKRSGELVYLGTSVVSGVATAIVTATGGKTAFGDVVAKLAQRAPETELERGLRRFGFLIVRVVFFLVLLILAVSLAARRDPMQSFLFALALAVGLTPELLPMISTVTLARSAVRMADARVIVKHLGSIQNLGSIDILCSDKTGTITKGEMALETSVDPLGAPSPRPLVLARVNSRFETGIKSPLDAAILASSADDAGTYEKRDEVPFDFERRRLSIVVDSGAARLLLTKGSPEGIVPLSTSVETAAGIHPMTEADRVRCDETFHALSAQGLRVLAVAWRHVEPREAYDAADERELCFAGFLGFSDPPLPDAHETLAALARYGVCVKILSGDNELVSRHVSAMVGLDAESCLVGDEIDHMTDGALGQVAERTTVFARLSPAQKTRVLLSLKRRGHVVGFLGDGINDAPSLHAADVGISVASAADVARDAADMILLEPNLRALHRGIVEGRRAFGNITKYLLMGTSSNFGNMLSMAIAALVLPFLPMLPTQILLNNLLYDVSQVTIPSDHVDEEFLRTPQRWDIRAIQRFMLVIGPVSSLYDFLTFYVLIHVFHASEPLFHTGWFVESLATQTLVLFVIRTRRSPLASRPSAPLTATVLGVVAIAIALPYTPLAPVLGFVPPPALFLAFVAAATATYLGLVELVKRRLNRALAGGKDSSSLRPQAQSMRASAEAARSVRGLSIRSHDED